MSDDKLSPVEIIKTASNFLRGDIGAEMVDGLDHFGKDSTQLLKHHGTYQQDDRDARPAVVPEPAFAATKSTASWSAPRFPAAS